MESGYGERQGEEGDLKEMWEERICVNICRCREIREVIKARVDMGSRMNRIETERSYNRRFVLVEGKIRKRKEVGSETGGGGSEAGVCDVTMVV